MAQVDYREILYIKIHKLDTLDRNYLQNFFNLIGLLLNTKDREELALMILDFRKEFDNGSGSIPTFYALESALYNMRNYRKNFIKIKFANGGFKKVMYAGIDKKVNGIKQWCFEKLYEIQKDIRFSGINQNIT